MKELKKNEKNLLNNIDSLKSIFKLLPENIQNTLKYTFDKISEEYISEGYHNIKINNTNSYDDILLFLYNLKVNNPDIHSIYDIKLATEDFYCTECGKNTFTYDCGQIKCDICGEIYLVYSENTLKQCEKCIAFQTNKCQGIDYINKWSK